MFQGLFKRAENTIDSVVSRFVARALVAIPLIVAAGFATAAVTVKLSETYGAVVACAIMAAAFALIGVVTMAFVSFGTQSPSETATEETQAASGEDAAEEGVLDPANLLLTPELRSFLASSAPMAIPTVARSIGRNLPLIFILALIGLVISRFNGNANEPETAADETAEEDSADEPPAAAA